MKPKMPDRFACPYCQKWSSKGINFLPHMQVWVCYPCAEANSLASISFDQITNLLSAKWTKEQVESLAAYQSSPHYFPLVCDQGDIFEATTVGLFCPKCEQILKRAYDWTLDWSWKTLIET
jgi:hypothetical protein